LLSCICVFLVDAPCLLTEALHLKQRFLQLWMQEEQQRTCFDGAQIRKEHVIKDVEKAFVSPAGKSYEEMNCENHILFLYPDHGGFYKLLDCIFVQSKLSLRNPSSVPTPDGFYVQVIVILWLMELKSIYKQRSQCLDVCCRICVLPPPKKD